jgi:hypothetical protein
MEELKGLYFVTAASGKQHIKEYAQYALKSLIKSGISIDDIHCIVNTQKDYEVVKALVPQLKNIPIVDEKINHIKWSYVGGKRKFSVFKAAGLHKCFTKPIPGKCMVYFDTDCLFFNNPTPFLKTKWEKTWFHHGKDLKTVSHRRSHSGKTLSKNQIDITNHKSLSQWVSVPASWCMIKHKAKRLPDKEAVAGFYILHPRDHEELLKLTYNNCIEISTKFKNNKDVGDQKPMNAALNILDVDWHGGDRFNCQEHLEFFEHYFGTKSRKKEFYDAIKKLKIG